MTPQSLRLVAEEGRSRTDELVVEQRAETLSASARVYALEFMDLAEFFDDLVTNGRGWRGAADVRGTRGQAV
jgi:hypothetical protein